mmetsp:Transcript_76797/g.248704  ORF Transcript_76797/g.248704 Transcript_76797/m.248704 type:complete len:298 (-) Transcript_76797:590-1483(-)
MAPPGLHWAFDWLVMPMIGRSTTLAGELKDRLKVPLRDYMSYAEEPLSSARPFALPLPLFVLRLLPTKLMLLLEVFARPRYLHDTSLNGVCSDALDWVRVPRLLLPNWFFAASWEKGYDKQVKDEPTFFIGRAQTMSYPMHKNIMSQLDFSLVVFEGAKRFSLFNMVEHDNLNPFAVGNSIWLYLVNAFAPDLVAAPGYRYARGFSGVLAAGEMLWVPGDAIHSFENFDFKQPTVAIKFWYNSHSVACQGEGIGEADCAARHGMTFPAVGQEAPTLRHYLADGAKVRESVRRANGLG